ncbi:Sec-independent protein translocase TatB [Nitrosomonas cryotolerans]|uniref:Sec-independent protein translocase protein TatB n=1 Tax=Nitrosomonas cryotolerans ATCC 49181 TaxID=1131553 RepID=A0A1N6JGM3_9PROT|nr:Sec-independent protein translocase protein TatB [Nitrosomonas cryotolerans]SFP67376.1 Sec-independent protein translocase TatB [Nitrosomonas cryotolerans]SIO43353.1 sec-independent protein translocase protein TatB [Nitrosomonas cryotolerans ATCC 49181]
MFDISFTEILIISIVALIVIGPERLPKVARTLGHLLGRVRRYVGNVRNDIQSEIKLEELKNLHASMQETAQTLENSMRQEMDQLKSAVEAADQETQVTASPPTTDVKAGMTEQQPTLETDASKKHDTLEKENK